MTELRAAPRSGDIAADDAGHDLDDEVDTGTSVAKSTMRAPPIAEARVCTLIQINQAEVLGTSQGGETEASATRS